MAATGPAKSGLGALIRRGWHEIPDVVAGTGVAALGLVLGLIGLAKYYANDGDNRRYKASYVVMRPSDPRAERVHKD